MFSEVDGLLFAFQCIEYDTVLTHARERDTDCNRQLNVYREMA